MNLKSIMVTGVACLLYANSTMAQRPSPPNTAPGHPKEDATAGGSTHSTSGPTRGGKTELGKMTRGQNSGGHSNSAAGNIAGHVQPGGGTNPGNSRGNSTHGNSGTVTGHTAAPAGLGQSRSGGFSSGSTVSGGISPADFAKILAFLQAMGSSSTGTASATSQTPSGGQLRGSVIGGPDGDDLANTTPHSIASVQTGSSSGTAYRGATQRNGASTRGSTQSNPNAHITGAPTVPSILPASTTPSTSPSLTPGVPTGLVIDSLYNGKAKAAGLQAGDIILKIDGMRTQTFEELRTALAAAKDQVQVEYIDAATGKTDTKTVGVSDSKIGVAVSETPITK